MRALRVASAAVCASIALGAFVSPAQAQARSSDSVDVMRAFGLELVAASHGNRIAILPNFALRGGPSGPVYPDATKKAKEVRLLGNAVVPGLELAPAAPRRTDSLAVQAHFRVMRQYQPYYEIEQLTLSQDQADIVASAYVESADFSGPVGAVKTRYHFLRKNGRWSLAGKQMVSGATFYRYLGPALPR